jgi:hypothetical protein
LKISIILIVLLSLMSCRKEEGVWDELTDAERTALRARASSKCLAAAADDVLDFTTTSNTELLRFSRLDSWKLEYKKASVLVETSNIYVWKVSGSTVYFLFKMLEGGSPRNIFVKFKKTTNSEMLEDLRVKKCAKIETETFSIGRSTITGKIDEGRVLVDADTYSKTIATHTYNDEVPAFFGFFNKVRVKTLYNDETDAVKSSETFNYVITRITDIVSLPTDFTNDTNYPNKTYCVVTYSKPAAINVYPLPNATAYGLACTSSSSVGPDPGSDGEDFDPDTELVY